MSNHRTNISNHAKTSAKLLWGVFFAAIILAETAWGQCQYYQVTHFSGTEQIGCNEVTVSSEGSVSALTICGYGPYWIGPTATGSYTFNFSPAVPEVQISLSVINDMPNFAVEELSFEINGSFYPITNPGTDDGCRIPCVIAGPGTIRCGPGDTGAGGSWQDVVITESISTLKISDVWLLGAPNGTFVKVTFCCNPCPTDAGNLTGGAISLCPGGLASVPPATQTNLEGNDLLQYILFSDLNDTLGSIIKTSNTPSFTFTSNNMQEGVTYYIAAIAGNNLNGTVDQNDPCLDVSNAIEVVWWPKPSVEFSVDDPNVCLGNCTDVTITMSGTPPFTLTFTSPATGTVTQVFQENIRIIPICTTTGSPPGSFVIAATSLADAHCTCN